MRKKLYLSELQKKLRFRVSSNMSLYSVKHFSENKYGDKYDLDVYLPSKDMNLQRGLVWSSEQKEEFIKSIFKGIQILPLSIIQYRGSPGISSQVTYKFIDGKQRFTTVLSFLENGFPIRVNGIGYHYRDLAQDAKDNIDRFDFTFNIAYEYDYDMISDDEKIQWFEMINFMGTKQDSEHLKLLKSR